MAIMPLNTTIPMSLCRLCYGEEGRVILISKQRSIHHATVTEFLELTQNWFKMAEYVIFSPCLPLKAPLHNFKLSDWMKCTLGFVVPFSLYVFLCTDLIQQGEFYVHPNLQGAPAASHLTLSMQKMNDTFIYGLLK